MKKTKRACATGVALRSVFTVMVALLLVFGFNACSNGGGGGGPAGGPGGPATGDGGNDGKYTNPATGKDYEVGVEITGDDGVSGKIFYDSFKDPDIMDYFTLYEDENDTVGVKARYLVVHPDRDETTYHWTGGILGTSVGVGSYIFVGGTEKAVGMGKRNTALILKVDGDSQAAKKARGYGAEWFLPSADELVKLAAFPENDLLYAGGYWSSTQADDRNTVFPDGSIENMYYAYAGRNLILNPDDYIRTWDKKSAGFRVFAVRAF